MIVWASHRRPDITVRLFAWQPFIDDRGKDAAPHVKENEPCATPG